MKHRMPAFFDRYKICIICEGDEEYDYLERLNALKVWHEQYAFFLDNADGNGNIPARYQDRYQNNSYDLVLVFCDTDKKPYEQYADIKRKINEVHGTESAAELVVIYGNPCTMQIILHHWTDIVLKSPAKKVNAPIIESCTGIKNYKGKAIQRSTMMRQITKENYEDMCRRVNAATDQDTLPGSTNFGRFMTWFSGEDVRWISSINDTLEQ